MSVQPGLGARLPLCPAGVAGQAVADALSPEELAPIEQWVTKETGASRLYQEASPGDGFVDRNSTQLVGEMESRSMPHTDSTDCRFAGVLYLNEGAPKTGEVLFYRLKNPDGSLGGNHVRRSTPASAKPSASRPCR